MTATKDKCPHGNDFYSGCASCDFDHRRYNEAKAAYESVSRNINGGSSNVLGSIIAQEHPYLTNELAEAIAYGILSRTYDRLCPDGPGNIGTHPEHDGRLSCGTVVGALRIMSTRDNEDVLKARTFWLGRLYQPL
jgi:hypothetical protein